VFFTSRRPGRIGQVTVNVKLADIVETSLGGDRPLLMLRPGEGLALEIDRPRQLCTEIAAAIRAFRP